MFKRVGVLIICFCIAIAVSFCIFAEEANIIKQSSVMEIITPQMNYIANAEVALSKIGSNKLEINCSVIGYQGITTKVKITANLQEYKNGAWQTINTYTVTSDSHKASMSRQVTVSSGNSYRVTSLIQAYSGNLSEIQIVRSNEVKL